MEPRVSSIRELARAKINLTLRVLGRRADGFHALESLVAFAETHDVVELDPEDGLSLDVEGPFGGALDGNNLVSRAAEAAKAAGNAVMLGRFRLVKHLPVAAGLGGGSADAAAALRLIARANPGLSLARLLPRSPRGLAPTLRCAWQTSQR